MATGLAAPPFWLFFLSFYILHISTNFQPAHLGNSLFPFFVSFPSLHNRGSLIPISLRWCLLSICFFLSLSILVEKDWTWKLAHVLVHPPLCFLMWEHFLTQVWPQERLVHLRGEPQHIPELFLQLNGRALASEGSYASPAPCCQKSLDLYPVMG